MPLETESLGVFVDAHVRSNAVVRAKVLQVGDRPTVTITIGRLTLYFKELGLLEDMHRATGEAIGLFEDETERLAGDG